MGRNYTILLAKIERIEKIVRTEAYFIRSKYKKYLVKIRLNYLKRQ